MSEVYVYQRTVLDALKIRKLCSFTFISPIVGHPVFDVLILSLSIYKLFAGIVNVKLDLAVTRIGL